MSEIQVQGKSLAAVARDIADGMVFMTPLLLKHLDEGGLRALHHQLKKLQTEVRGSKFPTHDVQGIRTRNLKLQRLHQSLNVLEHSARKLRIRIA
jgi:hypothetical protein